jgi:hypothetical protein
VIQRAISGIANRRAAVTGPDNPLFMRLGVLHVARSGNGIERLGYILDDVVDMLDAYGYPDKTF